MLKVPQQKLLRTFNGGVGGVSGVVAAVAVLLCWVGLGLVGLYRVVLCRVVAAVAVDR